MLIDCPMTCIETARPDHFEMFFWYMADQAFDEIDSRNSFFNILIIFMAIVMKSDHMAIVFVNPGGGNNGAAKITADIFDNIFGITFVGLRINIEAVSMLSVTGSFDLFERWPDSGFHFIKQGSTESITQISVIKVFDISPETIITVPAFREEAVDMGIPL